MTPPAALNTQQRRVYQAIQSFRGVTQVDFDLPNVIDGGKPIKRVAARVEELEQDYGLTVDRIGWRNKCRIYRLNSGAEGGGAQPERATAQRSSSETARAATLNAAGPSRWVCFATRECMSAGPLDDGRVCPRGSDHQTQSVIYVDLARSDDQEERLAA